MAIVRLFDAQVGSHDGFLLLSKLATEFSLCTRTEAIFFKQCMANFKLGKQQSVRDAVQLLESEMYLYEKLVQTISDSILRSEMFLQDGEKSRLLMLNLPENVRTFLQLHGGDTYTSQRDAAIRYYERTELKTPLRFIQVHSPEAIGGSNRWSLLQNFMGFIGQGYSYTYIPYHPCMVYLPTFGRLLW